LKYSPIALKILLFLADGCLVPVFCLPVLASAALDLSVFGFFVTGAASVALIRVTFVAGESEDFLVLLATLFCSNLNSLLFADCQA
jgi:hypothetical protein